jgi:hypothetical protein
MPTRLRPAVPTAPAWLQRAGLGVDVMGTGASSGGARAEGSRGLSPRLSRRALAPASLKSLSATIASRQYTLSVLWPDLHGWPSDGTMGTPARIHTLGRRGVAPSSRLLCPRPSGPSIVGAMQEWQP